MKKKILILITCLLSMTLMACGKNTTTLNTTSGIDETSVTKIDSSTTVKENQTTTVNKEFIDGKKLVVFGDSITALGTWGESVAEELNMYFYNGAKGGITSEEGLKRFDNYVRKQNPDFVTILFGQNDLLMTSKNNPKVSIEKFKENLTTMILWVRELNATPILLTNNPLNPDLFYTAQGQNQANYVDVGSPLEWLDKYNEAIREVAQELECFLVDNRITFSDKYYKTYLLDGIHLNAKGNEKFKKNVLEFFNEHYTNDPNAQKVSNQDLYKYVTSENPNESICSFNADDWYTVDDNLLKFIGGDNIKMYNTNGLWPEAEYELKNRVVVNVENGYIKYDIEIKNVTSSIILFIDGATPAAFTSGKYFSLNRLISNSTNSVGDIIENQHLVGTLPLKNLGISAEHIHDGNVIISGLKVFVAGTKNEQVIINEFSVSIE